MLTLVFDQEKRLQEKVKPLLEELGALDLAWRELREEYADGLELQVNGLSQIRKALQSNPYERHTPTSPPVFIISGSEEYYRRAQKKNTELETRVVYEANVGMDDIAFAILDKNDVPQGAITIGIPPLNWKSGESYHITRRGEIPDDIAEGLVKDYVEVRRKLLRDVEKTLRKHVGSRYSGMGLQRVPLILQTENRFDDDLWFVLGGLYSEFLDKREIKLASSTIRFGEHIDCSSSEFPGYSIAYDTQEGRGEKGTISGDVATAQKVIFDVCREQKMSLPSRICLENID